MLISVIVERWTTGGRIFLRLDVARTKLGSAEVGSSWQGLGSALLVSAWLHFAWLGPARAILTR